MATATLQRQLTQGTAEEQSIRVEDYLNDKIQSQADLKSIDFLLENVKQQQTLLREQVCLDYPSVGLVPSDAKVSYKMRKRPPLRRARKPARTTRGCLERPKRSAASKRTSTSVCLS